MGLAVTFIGTPPETPCTLYTSEEATPGRADLTQRVQDDVACDRVDISDVGRIGHQITPIAMRALEPCGDGGGGGSADVRGFDQRIDRAHDGGRFHESDQRDAQIAPNNY